MHEGRVNAGGDAVALLVPLLHTFRFTRRTTSGTPSLARTRMPDSPLEVYVTAPGSHPCPFPEPGVNVTSSPLIQTMTQDPVEKTVVFAIIVRPAEKYWSQS